MPLNTLCFFRFFPLRSWIKAAVVNVIVLESFITGDLRKDKRGGNSLDSKD